MNFPNTMAFLVRNLHIRDDRSQWSKWHPQNYIKGEKFHKIIGQ